MNQSESIRAFEELTKVPRNNRIWFMSELYWPEDRSTGFHITTIAESTAATLPVSVICSQPTYDTKGIHRPAVETRAGVAIYRTWNTKFDKNNLVLRLLKVLTFCLSTCIIGLRRVRRGDVIVCVTTPPFLPLVAWLISAVRKSRYIVLVYDVYPAIFAATGVVRPDSPPYRATQRLYNFIYKRAQGIIAIGQDMAERISADCPGLTNKFELIRNWADVESIKPSAFTSNQLVRQLGLADKFIVQYSGNIGRTHGTEIVVDAAERLRGDPEIHFLIIGTGAKRRWLEAEVKKRTLDNITFVDYQPRENLADTLCACHVALVTMAAGMLGLSVPSRTYNIMAAGRPIIAVTESNSEIGAMISTQRIGWVVKPGCADQLADAIRTARRSPEVLADMSSRASKAAVTDYARAKILDRYTMTLSKYLVS
ncbi:MAG: glycosyltransferase family 4 protein [Acidobacteriaceae bacterium]|nr:glycosyltransferase family 4 protein [Acidobacteriaceae bacterium]